MVESTQETRKSTQENLSSTQETTAFKLTIRLPEHSLKKEKTHKKQILNEHNI